jgi:hypothetical protein
MRAYGVEQLRALEHLARHHTLGVEGSRRQSGAARSSIFPSVTRAS